MSPGVSPAPDVRVEPRWRGTVLRAEVWEGDRSVGYAVLGDAPRLALPQARAGLRAARRETGLALGVVGVVGLYCAPGPARDALVRRCAMEAAALGAVLVPFGAAVQPSMTAEDFAAARDAMEGAGLATFGDVVLYGGAVRPGRRAAPVTAADRAEPPLHGLGEAVSLPPGLREGDLDALERMALGNAWQCQGDDWCGESTSHGTALLRRRGVKGVSGYVSGQDDDGNEFGGVAMDSSHSYIVLADGTILDPTVRQYLDSPAASDAQRRTASGYPHVPSHPHVAVIPPDHPYAARMGYESHSTGRGWVERPGWLLGRRTNPGLRIEAHTGMGGWDVVVRAMRGAKRVGRVTVVSERRLSFLRAGVEEHCTAALRAAEAEAGRRLAVFVVDKAYLDEAEQNQRVGVAMYARAAQVAAGLGGVLVPDMCSMGSGTSLEAQRLWRSRSLAELVAVYGGRAAYGGPEVRPGARQV